MGTFHAKMGSIKDRNGLDLTETEENNTMGKIRDFFKKIGALKGIFLFFFLSGRLYFIYISCKDEHGKGQKQSRPNRSRRNKEEVARIHRTVQKRSS